MCTEVGHDASPADKILESDGHVLGGRLGGLGCINIIIRVVGRIPCTVEMLKL